MPVLVPAVAETSSSVTNVPPDPTRELRFPVIRSFSLIIFGVGSGVARDLRPLVRQPGAGRFSFLQKHLSSNLDVPSKEVCNP
jgi:hypothetical protein